MPKFNYNQLIAPFPDLRQNLYNCFEQHTDSIMDLLDPKSGNTKREFYRRVIIKSLQNPGKSPGRIQGQVQPSWIKHPGGNNKSKFTPKTSATA
jgi:hypothetical protein